MEPRRRWQFPLWWWLALVVVAAIVFAGLRDPDPSGFLTALCFEVTTIALAVALLVAVPPMKPMQAFAAGFAAFSGLHFGLIALELHAAPYTVQHWQLLTYFASNIMYITTETARVVNRQFNLIVMAVNLWGLFGGLLALTINRRNSLPK